MKLSISIEQLVSTLRRQAKMACLLAIVCLILASCDDGDQPKPQNIYPIIWEQEIYEYLYLPDKSLSYYQMTISERYFDGSQNLAIKVIPNAFDSDPDIFISKNNTAPSNSLNSQWYCVKKGSDTCVIKKQEIQVGDILYIGIRCINACNYTLASDYFTTLTLSEGKRTQVRLDGFSSNMFEYYIPTDASDGFARAVTFTIESEDQYNPIDLYFSLDNTINQVDERKIENIMNNGVGTYFTEDDFGWCTRCFVYYFVDVIQPGRYYVTAQSSARNPIIVAGKKYDKFVNNKQQDCYQYFVQNQDNDVIISLQQYQGDVEFYIGGGISPNGPNDTSIVIKSERGASRVLILTDEDRRRTGYRTGLYEVCAFGLDDSSFSISPKEDNYVFRYDAADQTVYTFNLEKRYYNYFRYTHSSLASKVNITVKIQGYSILQNNQVPPRVFYKICSSENPTNCVLNDQEANGTSKGMTELSANKYQGLIRTGQINHDPSVCKVPTSCYYLISVFNPEILGIMKTSLEVSSTLADSESVNVESQYRNILPQGKYQYYKLLPGNPSSGIGYLDALTIEVESLIGDADLVISYSNHNPLINTGAIESRQSDIFESITLSRSSNFSLSDPIYIGVYAESMSIYTLRFQPQYSVSYLSKLSKAKILTEGVPVYNYMTSEYDEVFYSFVPWWAGFENKTIVFFAEVIFNNVFFYMQKNDFPNFYLTDFQDYYDTIAVEPDNPTYDLYSGYFVRARPDFALYDLISQRQYIFNFYAFSQYFDLFTDIHHNEPILGYGNGSSVYYRHFIADRNATYNFTVIPIIGNPALLLKVSNIPVYPQTPDVNSWDIKSDNPDKQLDSIVIDLNQRITLEILCETAGYWQDGGSQACTIYTAVECQGVCVYRLVMRIQQIENQTSPFVPIYITNYTYYTGAVKFNETKYFYYPVTKTSQEVAIIVNKTAPIGSNGDVMVLINFQSESITKKIANWSYPSLSQYSVYSMSNDSSAPEIIELCPRTFAERCGAGNNSCILLVAVIGISRNKTSNYRIMAQSYKNKLYEKIPIRGNIANPGDYDYYWFTSNASVSNPAAYWEHVIAVSVDTNGDDVDLFVSALDGRYPVDDDYDFTSNNLGPDDIYVRSNDAFWDSNKYKTKNGIMFIVGVKAMTSNVTYTLVMLGPNPLKIPISNLQTSIIQTKQLAANSVQYYRWFNWGFKDFRINIDVQTGNLSAYLNFVGEETFQNNAFLAIPWNVNNSRWNVTLNGTQSSVLKVYKDDYLLGQSQFCYYCMYYLTVVSNAPPSIITNYKIYTNYLPDVGEEVPILSINNNYTVTLPSSGTVQQRKFVLDCKQSFQIKAQVTAGYANIYVGLYPNNAQSKFNWKVEAGTGETATISIKQTDQSFHLGAYYYITLQAANGRTVINLAVNQRREVLQLQNTVIYKDNFWNNEERVKLYYFQIPYKNQSKVTINITALTEDFYPTVLLSKNIFNDLPRDPNTQFTYPNMLYSNLTFGDNFTDLAYQKQFSYSFRDAGNTSYTYWAVAVYSWSYGMTDRRKAEFKIQLFIDNLGVSAEHTEQKQESLSFLPNAANEETVFEKIKSWVKEKTSYSVQ